MSRQADICRAVAGVLKEAFAGTMRHYLKGWGDPNGKVRPIE